MIKAKMARSLSIDTSICSLSAREQLDYYISPNHTVVGCRRVCKLVIAHRIATIPRREEAAANFSLCIEPIIKFTPVVWA